ncbi:TPA: hypothetical protein ACGCLA_002353 [Legionella pneumophila]|nr:hypothetical protein [Legionella pneumophila]
MTLKWKTKKSPQFYLDQALELQINAREPSSLSGSPEFYVWAKCLPYLIDFPSNIDEQDINDSIKQALMSCIKSNDLNDKFFIEELSQNISKKRSRHLIEKHFETKISISFPNDLMEFKVFNSSIKIYTNKYDAYSRVVVEMKTSSDEHKEHLNCLNLLRGILCFFINHGMVIHLPSHQIKEPINRIKLSKNFRLSTKNNISIFEKKDEIEKRELVKKNLADQKHIDNINNFIMKLEGCRYANTIKQTLLLYVNALDEVDHNVSFILLWNCLDNLTNSEIGKYDEVINRVSSLYPNVKYHEVVLDYLRNFRNDFAHRGKKIKDATIFCYTLQEYVRDLIYFHLDNINKFENIDAAIKTLAFISNKKAINVQTEMHDFVSELNWRFKKDL